MRLWSLHPSYLDTIGLIACWREGLLARIVLQGKTKGYRNHPQLIRFKAQSEPVVALDQYLSAIVDEAILRGFRFDSNKITRPTQLINITVTDGQLNFELNHLKAKLMKRDVIRHASLSRVVSPLPNPIFCVIKGEIEAWERVPEARKAPSGRSNVID